MESVVLCGILCLIKRDEIIREWIPARVAFTLRSLYFLRIV